MHLGLIDELFVTHNLISAQESPVPLSKFQMAPKLKIIMSSGSTDILLFSLNKVPAKETPPVSPVEPLWRETPTYIS
jgi:hypothetical protein